MRSPVLIFILIFLFFTGSLFSQDIKRTNIWYFGRYAGVDFNSGEPVLKDVSMDVEAGETVALLGATGSGKSTIINLLTRFYDPSSGSITIEGYD